MPLQPDGIMMNVMSKDGRRKEESVVAEGCREEEDIGTCGRKSSENTPNNSFKIDTTSTTTSFLKSKKNVRPILVGYAFGKKKMSTMGIIMAEASKALSTIITATLIDDDTIEEVDDDYTMGVNSTVCEDLGKYSSKSMANTGKRQRGGNIAETISESSSTENRRYSKLTPTRIFNGREKLKPKRILNMSAFGNTNENLDEMSLDSDTTPPSLITLNTSFSFTSATCTKKKFPINSLRLINVPAQQNGGSSISSRWSVASDGLHTAEYQLTNTKTKNKHVLKRIRVSFVPLDLDSPLEEQHGGQFDVILHKLTEDILCISKLSPDDVPSSMKPTPIVTKAKYSHKSSLAIHNHKNTKNSTKQLVSALDESQKQAIARVERLNCYKRNHPHCCLVDHPADIKAIMSRADMTYVLSYCLQGVTTTSGVPVRNPLFHVLKNTEADRKVLTKLSQPEKHSDALPFSYPFIVKPLTAAGTSDSHKMGIVLGRKGIKQIDLPCLLQEYSNHDGILYKVYVLGDLVQVFPRISLPNLPERECFNEEYAFVDFDSQKTYPTQRDFGVDNNSKEERSIHFPKIETSPNNMTKKQKVDSSVDGNGAVSKKEKENVKQSFNIVTSDEIRPIATVIRNAFGLELFGFDILVLNKQSTYSSTTIEKEMLVVDVNYFPSYKEVSEFPSLLAQYLSQRAIEGRLKSFQSR